VEAMVRTDTLHTILFITSKEVAKMILKKENTHTLACYSDSSIHEFYSCSNSIQGVPLLQVCVDGRPPANIFVPFVVNRSTPNSPRGI
jgi:hypothetical protein